ncbi:amidohydrolase [Chryseolinea lacunae]|uniref:Amidohydrolase n=1 Tax=Chryseolinea lacunae TaxID=2801331 RepID=A0ABS1KRS7_9BACT|nr:amidohydrolase [Chryseolinea lacunae]MBL0742013.1 amidohydrolase [Chryseolinea lacunae]
MSKRLLLLLLPFLSCSFSLAQSTGARKILYNGKIFTANVAQPYADAVGIVGDKIVYVGTIKDVEKHLKGPATRIDLQGKFLMPGLVDSHNHALSGGRSLMAANLGDQPLSVDALIVYAAQTLQSRKGMRGDVLFIEGMHSVTWTQIDALRDVFNKAPYNTQPVVLRGSDGHTAWVNNVMLTRAGIDAAFLKGLSESDLEFFGTTAKGEPNGRISEEGFNTIRKILAPTNIDPYESAVLAVKHLNSLGITAWLDPATGATHQGEQNADLELYRKLSQQKQLTAHVAATVVADGDADVQRQIDVLKKLQQSFKSVNDVSVLGFKIFADGVLEYPTQTAAVSVPYKNSGLTGSLMFDPEKFKTFFIQSDKQGLLVHVHAIGDRAVTETLNAAAAARKANGNSKLAHSITHMQLVVPEDFKRFAALHVLASYQLLWATADIYTVDLVEPYLDAALFSNHYPAKSMMDNGATIAGASDWPVSSANPFEAIYVAETREGKMGVLIAREKMPRIAMLEAYTINAAKVMWRDKTIGSIEPGKQADFVLLDRDVLTVSPQEVKETHVLWTMFGGDVVFRK